MAKKSKKDQSELELGEYHPSANSAMAWYKQWSLNSVRYMMTKEALASTALSGNRLSEICLGTMRRLENGEPVSDRYLLGLCWFLREGMEDKA